jgi:hypothetical protein
VRGWPERIEEPTIVRVAQIEGADLYSVRYFGRCLNKSGNWEMEPMPSSRSDAFLKRCRFSTLDEAMMAAAIPLREVLHNDPTDRRPPTPGKESP